MAKVKNTPAVIDEMPEIETEDLGAVIDETPGPETNEVVFVAKMGFANQSGWHEVDEEYVPYSDFDRKALLRAGYIEVKK